MTNVVAYRSRKQSAGFQHELIELDSVETACRVLQKELAAMAFDGAGAYRRGYFYQIAAKAGLCPQCVSRIAYGVTRWPRLRTCLVLFEALGYKVMLQRA